MLKLILIYLELITQNTTKNSETFFTQAKTNKNLSEELVMMVRFISNQSGPILLIQSAYSNELPEQSRPSSVEQRHSQHRP